MTEEITELDVVQAIQDALAEQKKELDGYYTRRELQELTGWGRDKVRNKLRQIQAIDRLEVAKKRVRNIAGTEQQIPAYRILPDEDGDEE